MTTDPWSFFVLFEACQFSQFFLTFLSNTYPNVGLHSQPQIKSQMLYWLSQAHLPSLFIYSIISTFEVESQKSAFKSCFSHLLYANCLHSLSSSVNGTKNMHPQGYCNVLIRSHT